MRSLKNQIGTLLLAAAASSALFLGGCAVHARVYDPYYHDYHHWNSGEVVYYNQWEHDTHRDHTDFNKRNDADKKSYWDWRHSHSDQH
ncbi:MAG: hypothetical protein WCC26_15200 [Terracidiphilus sp.]